MFLSNIFPTANGIAKLWLFVIINLTFTRAGRLWAVHHGALPQKMVSIYATKVPTSHPTLTSTRMEETIVGVEKKLAAAGEQAAITLAP